MNGIFSKSKKCSEGWQQPCSQPFDGNYELKVPSFTLSGYIVYYLMQLLVSEAEAALLIEFTNVGKDPSTGQAVSR